MKQFAGYMKGVNLGGWLSQFGNHGTAEHFSSFIKKEDIEWIAAKGLDHVRLPIDYEVIQQEDGMMKPEGFVYIDDCLSWCKECGLNVVLDLHKTCGFVFDNEKYCDFFTDERLQDHFVKLWREMATRYGAMDYVAFELLNEVTAMSMAKPWNEIIKKTVPAIREIAPNVPIIVGGIFNSSIYGLTLMEAPVSDNMVYTFHCYSPFTFTHQGAGWVNNMPLDYRTHYPQRADEMREESLKIFGKDFDHEFAVLGEKMMDHTYFLNLFKQALEVAERFDVPLYCGEYGVIDFAGCDGTLEWYKQIHKALAMDGIGRSAWTYRSMNFGLEGEHYKPIQKELWALLGESTFTE